MLLPRFLLVKFVLKPKFSLLSNIRYFKLKSSPRLLKSNHFQNLTVQLSAMGRPAGKAKPKKDSEGEGSRKRKAEDEEGPNKKGKSTEEKDEKALKNPTNSNHNDTDYKDSKTTDDGKTFNLKISSWNVGGLRSVIKKGFNEYVENEDPDILCLQEVKCTKDKLPSEAKIKGYHDFWADGSGDKLGYAGVGLYSKVKPISVKYGLGPSHDKEGRLITAEFDKFYLLCCYTPNAGRKLVTLDKKLKWNEDFLKYMKELDAKKPVILAGDLNVSHQEIDLARPKSNTKSAGFTKEERDDFTKLLDEGFIDTFRHLNPGKKDAYTYWTYMANARANNVGWRLDYFVISEKLLPNMCDSLIRNHVFGSDHCPLILNMHF
ncbi:DNA-(apurinic or apyrimidinic site) endonuclease-like [Neocloeon triangulifer]|uniref:DNA-(apurinic or apyrimidinic site) endonuclease-like n=1 Tax=Neocloeon triangulifer TaxID=2078957 RepID=UPI00286F021A|nr:DNA-(apurinic or apyrimidinic site) endonuclease-like [Neocloeon triangulifer]